MLFRIDKQKTEQHTFVRCEIITISWEGSQLKTSEIKGELRENTGNLTMKLEWSPF